MPSRDEAITLIERLHEAQARLYTDGDAEPVRALLSDDIAWHVPGTSPIAGSYHGLDQVVGYMITRRVLADRTFRMHRLDVLTGSGSTVAVLTDGEAVIDGVRVGGRPWVCTACPGAGWPSAGCCLWIKPSSTASGPRAGATDRLDSEPRRGGRVVECTGLENRRRGNSSAGSNPAPSAVGAASTFSHSPRARG
jgi:hypothetical protein